MAGQSRTSTVASATPDVAQVADERDQMTVADLARGVLSKEIRPRAGDVRRLAEAVLAGSAKPKKAKKDAKKAQAGSGKKKDKGKKKLAKIPGQQKN